MRHAAARGPLRIARCLDYLETDRMIVPRSGRSNYHRLPKSRRNSCIGTRGSEHHGGRGLHRDAAWSTLAISAAARFSPRSSHPTTALRELAFEHVRYVDVERLARRRAREGE